MNLNEKNLDELKILILTGELSFIDIVNITELINKIKNLKINCIVKKIPIQIAAFINQFHVRKLWSSLSTLEKKSYSFILLPGFINWDTTELSNELDIPIYKGTKFASDLFELITQIRSINLSHTHSADIILKKSYIDNLNSHINQLKNKYELGNLDELNENYLEFENVNGEKIYVSSEFPPLIFAEIVNAPKMGNREILETVEYYINSGADVIDIGTLYNIDNTKFIKEIIPLIKKNYDIFVSIDSLNINDIIAAIESGADFILSIDKGNINDFLSYSKSNKISKDLGLVLIPLDESHTPLGNADEKADFLIELGIKLIKNNFSNLFYDALLQTPIKPGFLNSIYDYIILHDRITALKGVKYPLFMGFNNVTELIDADSSGILALLSLIAAELDVGGILVTEYSNKSVGVINETKKAINLAYLSKISKMPPINLGLNSFITKNKLKSLQYNDSISLTINAENIENIKNLPSHIENLINRPYSSEFDKTGFFKIYSNHKKGIIEVVFYPSNYTKRILNISGPILINGKSAKKIFNVIMNLNLITKLDHAFYIGSELTKAEMALKFHFNYLQEV